jgi:hypothetical protein
LVLVSPSETVGGASYSGAVYFRGWKSQGWAVELASLQNTPNARSNLGAALSVSSEYAAVATDNVNEVHTFTRSSNGVWQEDAESPLSHDDLVSFIEAAVALDGDTLAVGSHRPVGPAVFLYSRVGANWRAPATGDAILQAGGMFAGSIALTGDTLAVNGDPVRVFERNNDGTWSNSPLPVASKGPIALTDLALVFGPEKLGYNQTAGDEVRLFRRATESSNWQEQPNSPLPTSVGVEEQFGYSVGVDGRRVFVGAPAEPPGGAIYIYD